jgi:hypothetical protein
MCGRYSCNCIVNALRTFRNVQVTQDSGSLVRTQDADDFQRNDPVVLEESHELTIRLQWVSGVAGHLSSRCSMILNLLSRGLSAYFYLIPPLHGEGSNSIDRTSMRMRTRRTVQARL